MVREDRRIRADSRPTLNILAAWAFVSLILLATSAPQILAGDFHGPDDALRMVQVRDLLAGQPWYDLHQYRMAPPDGTLMHWSRLVDIPIAGLVLFFSLFLEMPMAERAAMVAVPLIVLLLTMLVIGRLAWRLFDRRVATFTCLVLLLLPLMAIQFKPMRIDHHAWQILSVAVAVWAISWRSAGRGGPVAGIAMAFGLMISMEVIFMSAAFGLILALRWLRDQHARWWLVSYMQALALCLVALFAVTRGLPDLATHCDVMSPPHLSFFLIAALGTGALAAPPAIPRIPLLIGLGVVGCAGLAFAAWSAPQCIAPPFSGMDPLVREFWYLNVGEGRPLWNAPPINAIPAAVQPLIAIIITLFIASRNRAWVREWWFEYAAILAVAYVGGLATFRSIGFASVLAAIPLGWFIVQVFDRWKSYKTLLPKLGLGALCYCVFLPAFPLVIYEQLIEPKSAAQGKDDYSTFGSSRCELRQNARLLNRLPAGNIFAPLDLGAVILYSTHHSVTASGHHRAEIAMHDVITGYIGSPEAAKPIIDRNDADFLVICTDLLEARNLAARGGEESLVGRLYRDEAPDWLEPIDVGAPEQFKVWRVTRE